MQTVIDSHHEHLGVYSTKKREIENADVFFLCLKTHVHFLCKGEKQEQKHKQTKRRKIVVVNRIS